MKVSDFIKNFQSRNFVSTKVNPDVVGQYIKKELEVKPYVPFAEKRELCEKVIDACNDRDESGLIKVDSVSRYIVFTISVISKYTNLEFSSGEEDEFDSLDEYDMLCSNHLLNPILEVIGEEYAACNNMLNMMMEDVIANNNTVEAVIGHALGKVSDSIDDLLGVFADKVEKMNLDLSQIDINKYKGLLELLPQK